MIYFDENGNKIETYDLTVGYLVDRAWIDHPAVPQSGHYEYNEQNVQTYVVDVPAVAAWREVTEKKYILYTETELAHLAKKDYAARLESLETINEAQMVKISEQEAEISNLKSALEEAQTTNDMLTECMLEMSEMVYA